MSTMPREQYYSDEFISWMVSENINNVVMIRTMDDFALTVERTIKNAADTQGVNLLKVINVNVNSNDYKTDLLKARELNPDAIYIVMQSDSSQALINKQIKELNIKVPILIHYARGDSDIFLEAVGEASEGLIYVSPRDTAKMNEFRNKFKAKYGRDPAISAATSYDITSLILQAFDTGLREPQEIYEFLNKLDGYDGYSGTYTYDNGFLAKGNSVIKKIIDGKREIIE
jgi:branched-chain amino acid transport system substrate-binding protein